MYFHSPFLLLLVVSSMHYILFDFCIDPLVRLCVSRLFGFENNNSNTNQPKKKREFKIFLNDTDDVRAQMSACICMCVCMVCCLISIKSNSRVRLSYSFITFFPPYVHIYDDDDVYAQCACIAYTLYTTGNSFFLFTR